MWQTSLHGLYPGSRYLIGTDLYWKWHTNCLNVVHGHQKHPHWNSSSRPIPPSSTSTSRSVSTPISIACTLGGRNMFVYFSIMQLCCRSGTGALGRCDYAIAWCPWTLQCVPFSGYNLCIIHPGHGASCWVMCPAVTCCQRLCVRMQPYDDSFARRCPVGGIVQAYRDDCDVFGTLWS